MSFRAHRACSRTSPASRWRSRSSRRSASWASSTLLLKHIGIDLYAHGFTISSILGVGLCYVYFQIPLMVILITPALQGLRPEWEEAAQSLGASKFAYLRHVAVPVLAPSVLGASLILFGNAFSAYATALALVGSTLNIVPAQIDDALNGNVLVNADRLGLALGVEDDRRGPGRDGRLLALAAPRAEVAAVSATSGMGGYGVGELVGRELAGDPAAGPATTPSPAPAPLARRDLRAGGDLLHRAAAVRVQVQPAAEQRQLRLWQLRADHQQLGGPLAT